MKWCSEVSISLLRKWILWFRQNFVIRSHRWKFAASDSCTKLITQKCPKFASLENEILSLSWYISKSFYRIWLVEMPKSMNKCLESDKIWTIEQKAIVWYLVTFWGQHLVQVNRIVTYRMSGPSNFSVSLCMHLIAFNQTLWVFPHPATSIPILKCLGNHNPCKSRHLVSNKY